MIVFADAFALIAGHNPSERQVLDLIVEVAWQRGPGDYGEFIRQEADQNRAVNGQDDGDVPAAGDVIPKMSRHRGPIIRYEQEAVDLAPFQNQGVCCPARWRPDVPYVPDGQAGVALENGSRPPNGYR